MKSNGASERLRRLTVADVMNKQVVTVGAHQPMCEVATAFLEHNISAAPVVDETNRFVGILSASDFLRRDCQRDDHHLQRAEHDQCWEIGRCGPDMACSYMTKAVQTVSPGTLLLRAAMIMSAGHIHRLPVLDEQNRVAGMVSTMDITATVVNVVYELDVELLKQFNALSFSRK